jgi:hypothetical protein
MTSSSSEGENREPRVEFVFSRTLLVFERESYLTIDTGLFL